ncbi:MAG: hypothetical protein KVP17_005068 [Porospora cf. gigantea B]|uniref:uncharacterized protein n=1 Tax=Porospora cf. gigantea B TaxID=2853592 RepID=UPI003571F5E3|nr:MAG: hypothetical protein KVP17_005068 [Porospora cf. gigantea B]
MEEENLDIFLSRMRRGQEAHKGAANVVRGLNILVEETLLCLRRSLLELEDSRCRLAAVEIEMQRAREGHRDACRERSMWEEKHHELTKAVEAWKRSFNDREVELVRRFRSQEVDWRQSEKMVRAEMSVMQEQIEDMSSALKRKSLASTQPIRPAFSEEIAVDIMCLGTEMAVKGVLARPYVRDHAEQWAWAAPCRDACISCSVSTECGEDRSTQTTSPREKPTQEKQVGVEVETQEKQIGVEVETQEKQVGVEVETQEKQVGVEVETEEKQIGVEVETQEKQIGSSAAHTVISRGTGTPSRQHHKNLGTPLQTVDKAAEVVPPTKTVCTQAEVAQRTNASTATLVRRLDANSQTAEPASLHVATQAGRAATQDASRSPVRDDAEAPWPVPVGDGAPCSPFLAALELLQAVERVGMQSDTPVLTPKVCVQTYARSPPLTPVVEKSSRKLRAGLAVAVCIGVLGTLVGLPVVLIPLVLADCFRSVVHDVVFKYILGGRI